MSTERLAQDMPQYQESAHVLAVQQYRREQKEAEEQYQRDLVQYEKDKIVYEKELAKYNADKAKYEKELAEYNAAKEKSDKEYEQYLKDFKIKFQADYGIAYDYWLKNKERYDTSVSRIEKTQFSKLDSLEKEYTTKMKNVPTGYYTSVWDSQNNEYRQVWNPHEKSTIRILKGKITEWYRQAKITANHGFAQQKQMAEFRFKYPTHTTLSQNLLNEWKSSGNTLIHTYESRLSKQESDRIRANELSMKQAKINAQSANQTYSQNIADYSKAIQNTEFKKANLKEVDPFTMQNPTKRFVERVTKIKPTPAVIPGLAKYNLTKAQKHRPQTGVKFRDVPRLTATQVIPPRWQVTSPDGTVKTFETEKQAREFSKTFTSQKPVLSSVEVQGPPVAKYTVRTEDGKVRTFKSKESAEKFASRFGLTSYYIPGSIGSNFGVITEAVSNPLERDFSKMSYSYKVDKGYVKLETPFDHLKYYASKGEAPITNLFTAIGLGGEEMKNYTSPTTSEKLFTNLEQSFKGEKPLDVGLKQTWDKVKTNPGATIAEIPAEAGLWIGGGHLANLAAKGIKAGAPKIASWIKPFFKNEPKVNPKTGKIYPTKQPQLTQKLVNQPIAKPVQVKPVYTPKIIKMPKGVNKPYVESTHKPPRPIDYSTKPSTAKVPKGGIAPIKTLPIQGSKFRPVPKPNAAPVIVKPKSLLREPVINVPKGVDLPYVKSTHKPPRPIDYSVRPGSPKTPKPTSSPPIKTLPVQGSVFRAVPMRSSADLFGKSSKSIKVPKGVDKQYVESTHKPPRPNNYSIDEIRTIPKSNSSPPIKTLPIQGSTYRLIPRRSSADLLGRKHSSLKDPVINVPKGVDLPYVKSTHKPPRPIDYSTKPSTAKVPKGGSAPIQKIPRYAVDDLPKLPKTGSSPRLQIPKKQKPVELDPYMIKAPRPERARFGKVDYDSLLGKDTAVGSMFKETKISLSNSVVKTPKGKTVKSKKPMKPFKADSKKQDKPITPKTSKPGQQTVLLSKPQTKPKSKTSTVNPVPEKAISQTGSVFDTESKIGTAAVLPVTRREQKKKKREQIVSRTYQPERYEYEIESTHTQSRPITSRSVQSAVSKPHSISQIQTRVSVKSKDSRTVISRPKTVASPKTSTKLKQSPITLERSKTKAEIKPVLQAKPKQFNKLKPKQSQTLKPIDPNRPIQKHVTRFRVKPRPLVGVAKTPNPGPITGQPPTSVPPNKRDRTSRKKKSKSKRDDFLGNSRTDNIVGLYKRTDIIIGDKKTAKQLRIDKKTSSKKKVRVF